MRVRPALPVLLGLLGGLCAAMQLAPLYMPAAGYLLAMASSLPVAVATTVTPRRCTWFFVATALVIGLVSREEMAVFITTTGPLGIMLGLMADRPAWMAVPSAGIVLAGGMILLPSLGGVYPFGGLEVHWSPWVLAGAYLLFGITYAALWHAFFARLWGRMSTSVRYTRVDEVS